jgi:multiple sugar transport system permease protein
MEDAMKGLKRGLKKYRVPLLFITPTLVLLITFYILPILLAFGISFTDMNLKGLADFSKIDFIGLENYSELFSDPNFLKAVFNTFYYVIFGVPLVIVFSLGIALMLNSGQSKIYSAFRAVYYAPAITNTIAVAVIWTFLYNSHYGLFNYIIEWLGGEPIMWLSDPKYAKFSLIILAVWKAIGINMLIFLAALKGIPKSLYEAADLDGANGWNKFIHITLPQLKFSMFFVVTTTLIGWMQFFEEPFVMTEGGPLNSTISMSLFIYKNGFGRSKFGYSAAGSFILFAMIIAITLIQFKLKKKEA